MKNFVIGFAFLLLGALLGWIGNQHYNKVKFVKKVAFSQNTENRKPATSGEYFLYHTDPFESGVRTWPETVRQTERELNAECDPDKSITSTYIPDIEQLLVICTAK
ncbi:MAG TPA: hypothetical protein VJB34_04875 [Bdellovibrionota bacterium]|nr:hypothetical protein [Bdellovibrionota bacterium]